MYIVRHEDRYHVRNRGFITTDIAYAKRFETREQVDLFVASLGIECEVFFNDEQEIPYPETSLLIHFWLFFITVWLIYITFKSS